MNPSRAELLQCLEERTRVWDIIVIGGGATGLGTAVDAASRGYRTLLLEQGDFGSGTSSRSTKLIHGGIRYLQQGNLPLVREALHERRILLDNAPHLVHDLPFIIPLYDWWESPFYGIGLELYDLLAGRHNLTRSSHLSREETVAMVPTVRKQGLKGGIVYHDGQFDDARLALCLARTMADLGGTPLNYVEVLGLAREAGGGLSVVAREQESGTQYNLSARAVINATGIMCDRVRLMDDPHAQALITPSQGTHLVLDRSFLPGNCAVMVPRTDDGRVFFAIPWCDRVLLGTTDTPVSGITRNPVPFAGEVDFLLSHAGRWLDRQPTRADALSCFAGLRPLAGKHKGQTTAQQSREQLLTVSGAGLVTITGGKWTTYRSMGMAAVDAAVKIAGLARRPSKTEVLRLHGWQQGSSPQHPRAYYGSESGQLEQLAVDHPDWAEPLHPHLPYSTCEVVWAVRREWALTVEDVLARRTRALFLDARASIEMAAQVARIMAQELGRDLAWQADQVNRFVAMAEQCLPVCRDGDESRHSYE